MRKNIDNSPTKEQVHYKVDLSCLKLGRLIGHPLILSIKPPRIALPNEYPRFVDLRIAELYVHNKAAELQRLAEGQNSLDETGFIKAIHHRRIKTLLKLFGVRTESSSISYCGRMIESAINQQGTINLVLKDRGFIDTVDAVSRIYLNVHDFNPPKFNKKESVWYFGRLYRVIKNESKGIVTIFNPKYGKLVVDASELHKSNLERFLVKNQPLQPPAQYNPFENTSSNI